MDKNKIFIGPLDEAYIKALTFSQNLANALYLNDLLQRIEKLENLLQEDLTSPTRGATELLLEQLNNTLQDMIMPEKEDGNTTERNEAR